MLSKSWISLNSQFSIIKPTANCLHLIHFTLRNLRHRCCAGDFNEILYQNEKEGIRLHNNYQIELFRSFVDRNRLVDMKLNGCFFTWCNNRSEGCVKEKIDRVLVNGPWLRCFPGAYGLALPACGSDHSPIIVNLQQKNWVKKKQFRFEDFWAEEQDCSEVVDHNWNSEQGGTGWDRFIKRKDKVASGLVEWSKRKFKRADKRIRELKREIKNIQNCCADAGAMERLRQCKEEVDSLWKQEESFWKARSRVKWLRSGDRNSRFFHLSTVQRRTINRISRLKNEEGTWLEDHEEIKESINCFYISLFQSSEPGSCEAILEQIQGVVNENQNRRLTCPITMEEVKEAVFGLGTYKAPGLDGLNGLFYQKNWEVVKLDIFEAVTEFFEKEAIPTEINLTYISLIPKIQGPEDVSQFRPISCSNFIYKIIAKILANRMKLVMDTVVSQGQSAFIYGRQIQDNILVAQEVFNYLKHNNSKESGVVAIKLDMSKAYDRLEWCFIEKVMIAFGFHTKWVKLIMACISSVSYQIKFNGDLGSVFYPQRGLRQGDPLSPYLFVLATEALSRLISSAVSQDQFSGIKLAQTSPTLTHLMFADDAMVFSKVSREEIYVLQNLLNEFSLASGQRINIAKSGLMFSKGTPMNKRHEIANILRIPIWDSPAKYLGLPGEWGRSRNNTLTWIKDRVWNKIQGWKEKMLNPAGKETLIKSVVQAIPSHAMSIIRLPKSFCAKLSSMVAKFWWSQGNKDKGIHWVKWEKVSLSKKKGGLGFRDFQCLNIALLAKQVWRLANSNNSLWSKVLKSVYYPNCSLWEARKKKNCSWPWTSLLEGRDFLKRYMAWEVASGNTINILADKWVIGGERIWELREDSGIVKVKDLFAGEERRWDEAKVAAALPRDLARKVLATPINIRGSSDKPIWPYSKNGGYTVKSGYHLAAEEHSLNKAAPSTSEAGHHLIWKRIWNAKILPKIKSFLWRACSNALPTKDNLTRRRVIQEATCPICHSETESIEHLFLRCHWVRAVWFGSPFQWVVEEENQGSFIKWLEEKSAQLEAADLDKQGALEGLFWLLWEMWRERNYHVFEGSKINPLGVLDRSRRLSNEFFLACENQNQPVVDVQANLEGIQRWTPPPQGSVKVNVDAATNLELCRGAIAGIFRDSNGDILSGFAKRIACATVEQAEALAIKEALILINAFQVQNVIVESDNQKIVQGFNKSDWLWQISLIMQECLDLGLRDLGVSVLWIKRSANKAADMVANLALNLSLPLNWCWSLPVALRAVLLQDKQVTVR